MARDDAEKKPNVVNGRLERCSPSQIKTWRLCQLKWVDDKVHNWPRKPEGKGVILGKEGHGQIETWAMTGDDIRSELARLSDPYLKPFYDQLPFMIRKNPAKLGGDRILSLLFDKGSTPDQFSRETDAVIETCGALIEKPIPKLFTPGGVEMVGYADMIFRPGHDLMITAFERSNVKGQIPDGGFFDARRLPVIVDHKFRSNVEKYAESATELEMDEQAIIYGRACLELWPDAQQMIVFRHHNHQTKGRRFADSVTCVLGSDHIRLQWKAICDLIDGPMQAAAKSGGLTAAWNESACNAYGGCDFEERCPNSPSNRLMAFIRPSGAPAKVIQEGSKPMASLADRLAAATGAAPAAAAAPAAPSTPAPAPAQQPAAQPAPVQSAMQPAQGADFIQAAQCKVGNLYMVMLADGGGVFKCEGIVPTGAFFTSASKSPKMAPLDTFCRDVTDDATARANFGLPPLQAAPAAPAQQLANTNPTARMPIVENGVQVSGVPLPGVPQSGPAALPVTPPDMPAHSPAPNMVSSPPATQATPTPAAQPAAQQTPPATEEKPAKATRGKGKKGENTINLDESLILLVNCTSANARDLSGFVFEIASKVAAKAGVPDVRLTPTEHALAFGRWKPAVAGAALAECPKGLCSIRSGELADPIIEALAGVADYVVR